MMIRFAAIGVLGLLTLAACEQRQAEPAAPAPAAEAPAVQPALADILTADGLGPARIGMTRADLVKAWGDDAQPNAVGGPDSQACDIFHPAKAPEGVQVMVQDGVLTRITLARGATIKTDRGLGLGDTAMAIKQTYGGAVFAQPHKYRAAPAEDLFAWSKGGSTAYVTDPAARGVRYEIGEDGKVAMIHAGDPSIQLVEGCS
ncbi:hypothetical protein [Brevundimonas sp. SORGH_AS_0993]|uniref:hypothetical protein n=1 Tax=Brevundimonas sp. SORGH_AS_0993 TaxID=3041794 RepID=UPI002783043F|nr:hypothetical protein [Brevundimonas sp. SORGH_AS_0993]MDQ1153600.1 hypothetical protein [Brevundimonas sp. SORGH_AS_0993]